MKQDRGAAWLAQIVESSGDALYSADLRGRVTSWNRGAQALYGYSAKEIIGRPLALLWTPDERWKLPLVMQAARRGQAYRGQGKREDRRGRTLFVSASMFPIRDETGHVRGVSILSRDVSADHKRRQIERMFLALMEASPDAILALDERGRVSSWNRGAAELFGYSPERAIGKPISSLFPDLRARGARDRLLALARAPASARTLELRGRRKDGGSIDAEVVVFSWDDGGQQRHALIVRDVSVRKRAEEADRLRESERLQRDFVANVSHELRTPVAAIRGFAETLRRSGVDDPRTARRFAGIIEKHSIRLADLIEDLLDLSVIESGKRPPRKKTVSLDALLRRTVGGLAPLLRRNRQLVRVVSDPKLRVRVDESRIEQVLQNLLSNAIKFGGKRGRIGVTARRLGSQAAVTVSDSGPGIPAEALPHLFQRFNRASKRRPGGGTGLGLSIAKELVEGHGGRIWAESVRGKGAAFHFTLPLR